MYSPTVLMARILANLSLLSVYSQDAFPVIRPYEIRNFTASLILELYHNFRLEPHLLGSNDSSHLATRLGETTL